MLKRPDPSATRRGGRRLEVVAHRSLSAAESCWRTLQADGVVTAYQHWDWADAIGRELLEAIRAVPVLVEVRDADTAESLMLLPLQRRHRAGIAVLQTFGAGVVDYTAPLIASALVTDLRADPALAVRIWAAIRPALPPADLFELAQIPETLDLGGDPVSNPLAAIPGLRPSSVSASGVRMEGDAATILRRLSSSQTVRSIASSRRKLEKDHEVRFVSAHSPDERAAMLDALLTQRRERFRELGRFDLIRREEVERFYRRAARTDLVQLSGISVDGEWIAMAYGLVHRQAFYGIILSIGGATWRPFSPGMLLITELLRTGREAGLAYFDFTVGTMAYKARFGAQPLLLWDMVVPLSWRGRIWNAGAAALAAAQTRLAGNERLYGALRNARRALRKVAS